MRDLNRPARTLDFSLELRQIGWIVAGSLVVIVVAFALGVGFGHRLATASAQPPKPTGDLAHLDTPKPAPSEPIFTYQQELTKKDPPPSAKPPPPPPPPKPEPTIQADAAKPPTVQVADTKTGAAPVLAVAPPPAPAVEPAAPAEKPTEPPKVDKNERWTVQFGAPSKKADADRLVNKLAALGYEPFITETDVPGKGHFYRVRIGRFPTKADADHFRAEARGKSGIDSMVVSAPAP